MLFYLAVCLVQRLSLILSEGCVSFIGSVFGLMLVTVLTGTGVSLVVLVI